MNSLSITLQEILKLPDYKKLEIADAIYKSLDEEEITDEEIAFARERYELHLKNPGEGISWDEAKKILWAKYGI